MSVVLIRQIPDDYAESVGLSRYNRSRMPGCKDRFSAAINEDGRYLTGLDEKSFLTPSDKREAIRELRESLEQRTGKDLSGTSPFWESFIVVIDSDKPKIFNTENPMDVISLKVLIANKNVAPTKEDAESPQYRDAQYYAYTEEGEVKEEVSSRKKRDQAIGKLIDISENKDKMLLYGQYLEGLKYQESLSPSVLYKMLRAYIEDKDIKHSENFIKALGLSVEAMQQKIIVDKAFKKRLISKVNVGNKKWAYQYGQVTLGSTVEDVYKSLSLPEFASDLMAIKASIENK